MSAGWLEQRERGSPALMRFMAWLSLTVGRSAGRLLLYPICLYFLLFSLKARRAVRQFRIRLDGRHPGPGTIFRHYFAFASTILDRVFFLSGETGAFDIRVRGTEHLPPRGTGCLLLGAHLGSFESVRCLGLLRERLPLKVLMYPGNARRIGAIVAALNPDIARSVIPLGTPAALLAAREWLADGGLLAMLADRTHRTDKRVRARFLGEEAWLPEGPLRLARILGVPVVLFFGLYRGGNSYELVFESFPVSSRDDVAAAVQRYAKRLEHHCRTAPENWFNFYDFWEDVR